MELFNQSGFLKSTRLAIRDAIINAIGAEKYENKSNSASIFPINVIKNNKEFFVIPQNQLNYYLERQSGSQLIVLLLSNLDSSKISTILNSKKVHEVYLLQKNDKGQLLLSLLNKSFYINLLDKSDLKRDSNNKSSNVESSVALSKVNITRIINNYDKENFEDEKFYKYKSLVNQYTKDSINNGTVYFPLPNQLNDPFEFSFCFEWDCFKLANAYLQIKNGLIPKSFQKEYDFFYSSLIDIHGKENMSLNELLHEVSNNKVTVKEKMAIINFLGTKTHTEDIQKKETDSPLVSLDKNNIRILSLTKRNDDILMWSYYGDSHKGVSLEYKFKDLINGIEQKKPLGNLCFYGDVKYSKKRPHFQDLRMISPFLDSDALQLLFALRGAFTKFIGWKHEKEFRIVTFAKANAPYSIKCKPSFLFFGAKSDDSISNKFTNINKKKFHIDKDDFSLK